MSSQVIVQPCALPYRASIRLPIRNLLITFALTILMLAAAGAIWGSQGHQILIVAMGWPHILLGFLFYFGKVLRGDGRSRLIFLLLCLGTLAFWSFHFVYALTGLIAIYFTYHVFRDEVFIYFQTRSKHSLRNTVKVAGLVPFIVAMFLITDPRPQHYRQDLRRVDMTNQQLSSNGWTFFYFEPIPFSSGKQFYFYLQTPNSDGAPRYTTQAAIENSDQGEIRISDRRWTNAADLVFAAHYAGEPLQSPRSVSHRTIPIALNGGHRVGQTFTAQTANLDGIWLPTEIVKDGPQPGRYRFHLTPDTSVPWAPLSPTLRTVRIVLLIAVLAFVVWIVAPRWREYGSFWLYVLFLIAMFAGLQKLIRWGDAAQLVMPIMFQVVVVFHYWSWYVFSIDKLAANAQVSRPAAVDSKPFYDRVMGWFGSLPKFIGLVLVLNLISTLIAVWYGKLHGPPELRFAFDYSYFLYFLVLHVTLSFAPKRAQLSKSRALQNAAAATT